MAMRNPFLYRTPLRSHAYNRVFTVVAIITPLLPLWEFSFASSVPATESIATHLKHDHIWGQQGREEHNLRSEKSRSGVHCPLPIFLDAPCSLIPQLLLTPCFSRTHQNSIFPPKLSSNTTSSAKLFFIPIGHGLLPSILVQLALFLAGSTLPCTIVMFTYIFIPQTLCSFTAGIIFVINLHSAKLICYIVQAFNTHLSKVW